MSGFDPYEQLYIALNADGSLTRFLKFPTTPATADIQVPGQATVSKDVVLDADKKTWLRIFRPAKLPDSDEKLPIVIYFHGGAWIQFSAASSVFHSHCNLLSNRIPAIVVSVEYRLAPESRLPAQYHDAVDSILWVKKQAVEPSGEEWLRSYGDFSRCFLYGCSNGGNIAFNAAIRALDLELEPVKIDGVIMGHPMFSGEGRTRSELTYAADDLLPLPSIDLLWELALPACESRDHRYSNPLVDGPHQEKIKSLPRFLVIGFGSDPMVDMQQDFVEMLVLRGVLVEARFDDVGFHGIELVDSKRGEAVLVFVKEFLGSCLSN